jgi:hypothetical protein
MRAGLGTMGLGTDVPAVGRGALDVPRSAEGKSPLTPAQYPRFSTTVHKRGTAQSVLAYLASHYLTAWLITRLEGSEAAESALHDVAPVAGKEEYVARSMRNITPHLQPARGETNMQDCVSSSRQVRPTPYK